MSEPKHRRQKAGPQRTNDQAGVKQVTSQIPDGPETHDDAAPGELLEGEGDPGLTITGGSGHA